MSRVQATLPKEIHDVLLARWEGFKVLARKLPDHHILAVELIRTLDDETIAVFTVVRNGEPVRSVVRGDAHGKVKSHTDHCLTTEPSSSAREPRLAMASSEAADPAVVALGDPPPHQPSTPGIVAIGEGLLGAAFDVGELVNTATK